MMISKILFILTVFAGGGIEKTFVQCARSIRECFEDIEVYLFVIEKCDEFKNEIPEGITFITKRRDLLKLFHHKKNSLIINYSGDWKSSLLSSMLAKSYISWIHCNPNSMRAAKTAVLNYYLIERSKVVVCVSNEQANIFKEQVKRNVNITVIHNCFDIKSIEELKDTETKRDLRNSKYFLMVSRFDLGVKDFRTLIDAYSLLDKGVQSKYKLVLLGNGDGEKLVKKYVEYKGISKNVVFPGYDCNPYRWMSQASICVLSSKSEGFPGCVIEEMICKSPVVITDYRTGAREVSQDNKNCIMIKIGDTYGLVRAIETILEDDDMRERMIANAYEYAKEFDYPQYKMKIRNIIEAMN